LVVASTHCDFTLGCLVICEVLQAIAQCLGCRLASLGDRERGHVGSVVHGDPHRVHQRVLAEFCMKALQERLVVRVRDAHEIVEADIGARRHLGSEARGDDFLVIHGPELEILVHPGGDELFAEIDSVASRERVEDDICLGVSDLPEC
jgi:hypothetical protein